MRYYIIKKYRYCGCLFVKFIELLKKFWYNSFFFNFYCYVKIRRVERALLRKPFQEALEYLYASRVYKQCYSDLINAALPALGFFHPFPARDTRINRALDLFDFYSDYRYKQSVYNSPEFINIPRDQVDDVVVTAAKVEIYNNVCTGGFFKTERFKILLKRLDTFDKDACNRVVEHLNHLKTVGDSLKDKAPKVDPVSSYDQSSKNKPLVLDPNKLPDYSNTKFKGLSPSEFIARFGHALFNKAVKIKSIKVDRVSLFEDQGTFFYSAGRVPIVFETMHDGFIVKAPVFEKPGVTDERFCMFSYSQRENISYLIDVKFKCIYRHKGNIISDLYDEKSGLSKNFNIFSKSFDLLVFEDSDFVNLINSPMSYVNSEAGKDCQEVMVGVLNGFDCSLPVKQSLKRFDENVLSLEALKGLKKSLNLYGSGKLVTYFPVKIANHIVDYYFLMSVKSSLNPDPKAFIFYFINASHGDATMFLPNKDGRYSYTGMRGFVESINAKGNPYFFHNSFQEKGSSMTLFNVISKDRRKSLYAQCYNKSQSKVMQTKMFILDKETINRKPFIPNKIYQVYSSKNFSGIGKVNINARVGLIHTHPHHKIIFSRIDANDHSFYNKLMDLPTPDDLRTVFFENANFVSAFLKVFGDFI